MSSDMYLMQSGFVSGIESDEFNSFAYDTFAECANSFISEEVQIYATRMTDTPVTLRVVIQNDTTDNPQYSSLRQILCPVGTHIRCGNYIKRGDEWWLVPHLPGSNGFYEKAFIWYCNYIVNFVSPLTGNVTTYPVFTENGTRYNSGERETTQMAVGTSQHIIYIPNNEETILIDNGLRLLMDYNIVNPTTYKVSQVDTTSYAYGDPGRLLRITITEDQFNKQTDNALLGIANYARYGSVPENEGSTFFG